MEDVDDSKSCRGNESYGFTKEQYDQLVHLLHASNSNRNVSTSKVNHVSHYNKHTSIGITQISYYFNHSNIGSWLVDSGASDHICSSMRFFGDYKKIVQVNIILINGQMAIAKHVNIAKFSPELIAHNLLFMLDLNLNFLFVLKLCLDIDCTIIFDNDKCLILENKSLRMIGSTNLIEGLYFLDEQDTPQATISLSRTQAQPDIISIPKEAIWNFRLGHIFNKRLLTLHYDFPFVSIDKNDACDICHYAKHKKRPFQISNHTTTQCYELFHFDIWSPLSIASLHVHKYFTTTLDG